MTQANGPAALFGLKAVSTAGPTATGTAYHYHQLSNLLPDRLYSVSWWMKATSGFNLRLRVGLVDSNGSSPTSLATVNPADITVRNDGIYRRCTAVFQMKDPSFVNPDFAVAKYLLFQFDRGIVDSTGGNIFLTNIMVNQGEWVPAYRNARDIPSGGIIEWDQSTTCPEGYVEVVAARNKLTVGAGNVAPGASGGSDFNPSVPGISTSAVNPPGNDLDYGSASLAAGSGHLIQGGSTAGPVDLTHSHTVDSNLPYYGVLKCRAL